MGLLCLFLLCTLCTCRVITQLNIEYLRNISNIIRHKTLICSNVYIHIFTAVPAPVRTVSLNGKLCGVCTRLPTASNRLLSRHEPALVSR